MSRLLSVLLCAAVVLGCAAAPAVAAAPRIGTAGDDTLTGTGAPDVLEARGGDDDAYGAAGRDVISAGPGGDQLLGGRGADVLAAGPGADQVHADDGLADVLSCGPGLDTYFADRWDRVGADCERNGRSLLRGGALATFDVVGERFRAWVTAPDTIWELHQLAAGNSAANIPAGSLRRGPGRGSHNTPFSWHLDPRDTVMAEAAIELCDAVPSHVERRRDEFVDVVRAFCPWGARLVEVRDYTGRPPSRPPLPPPGGGPIDFPDPGP
jgi:hypothetical protein